MDTFKQKINFLSYFKNKKRRKKKETKNKNKKYFI
jgi:hypothetical protein